MHRQSTIALGAIATVLFLGGGLARGDDAEYRVVTPAPTDAILANPGVGWQTFHRTSRQDRNLPAWIPSTVHYARWGWGTLEPEPGKIDYEFLEETLAATDASGQTLAFRAMCCSSYPGSPYHPAWLRARGGRILTTRYGDSPELEVPDLDDPVVLEAHLDFIRRLGERLDGDRRIAHVDIGTVGWWGEWHMSQSPGASMPSMDTQKKIVDAYFAAFQKTPLVMLIGGGEMLEYATERGAGWRADCLGDLGGFSRTWCHMRIGYPRMLPAADATEAWKVAPVAWESCWDMRKWVDEGWSLRFIFNYALALHGSVINNKSAPLPEGEEVRFEIERFLRRLGHRLVLSELRHPASVAAGERLELQMEWRNTGSAPCYQPFRLACRLTDSAGRHIPFVLDTTVNRWMPGSIPVFDASFFEQPADLPPGDIHTVRVDLSLAPDLAPGVYGLAVAVVDENANPVLQLGIEGRGEDGWYRVSQVRVTER